MFRWLLLRVEDKSRAAQTPIQSSIGLFNSVRLNSVRLLFDTRQSGWLTPGVEEITSGEWSSRTS